MIPANQLIAQARSNLPPSDLQAFYAQWASTYNTHIVALQNYVAPILIAQIARQSPHYPTLRILDAGCGTGLVGVALAESGAMVIDGLDFSPAMLAQARLTGCYRNLLVGDLLQKIEVPDGTYDLVTCAGTFTHGHVGPDPALKEFTRILIPSGLIIATVLEEAWESEGYKAEIEKLEVEGILEIVSVELKDYRKGCDKAHMIVLKKKGSI
ncbi:putative williams-beuren syndrome chromosome protein [Botrytis fragariae]|uniref:Putative williams-beuren syndrome chromosome protein n=1 Tax=Botrytis fragariae TaxID=1964551 RepID=A0A8H6EHN9_9HELO|nr:putative williams-beuren syndrome chromosome protein [Botrytis fragariae]KAF5872553.1 putative williams-beuren syndrome chromosome protein [Botrytis fragariae]